MSEPPIADYLAGLRRRLRWHRRRERVLAEVDDHLRAAAGALQERGMTAEAAAREAIAQLGSPDDIVPRARRNRIRVAATIALVALVAGGVIVGVSRPWFGGSGAATAGNSSAVAAKGRSHPAEANTKPGTAAERSMAVFSQTRTSRDALPSALAASMKRALSDPVGIQASLLPGALHFNESRLLVSSAAGSLYAVPTSSEHVCLTDTAWHGGCVDSFAHFSGAVSWGVGETPGGGAAILDGATPNDVTHITVNLGDGTSASATMGRNGFIYAAPSPTVAINSLTIVYTDGPSQTITIGYNPETLMLSAALTQDRAAARGARHPGQAGRSLRG